MARRLPVIFAALVVCGAGCFESGSAVKIETGDGDGPGGSAGMIQYLRSENLPAVESVQEWRNDYGPGLRLTTRHYEVFTTLMEPLMLRQLPGFMESAYRAYNGQLPEAIETKTKFTVYVFGDRRQWEDFTRAFAGEQAPLLTKIKAGAYCLNGVCVAFNIGRERTFSVLGHEGWHQFSSKHFKFRLPSWLDEGIAMLFENSRYEQGMSYFEPGRNINRLGALMETLANHRMVPAERLVGMSPSEVLATDDTKAVTAFYGQSYALVRFLREEGYGKRLGNYHRLLLDGLHGRWPLSKVGRRIAADRNIPLTTGWNRNVGPKLFRHYISGDFDQIEREYQAFCRKIVYHVRIK